jgi:cell division protein FtsW (lipid II flippase)
MVGDSRSSSVSQPEAPRVVGANPQRQRDALVGGLILAVAVAGLGLVAIITAAQDVAADPANSETSAGRSIIGWVLVGLALALLLFSVSMGDGERRTRYSLAVVSIAFGGSLVLFGLPIAILATPFFVSAYLLLRSLPAR